MKKDVIVAFVCLLGSIFLFLLLGTIQEERAKRFPEVLIIVMGGCGCGTSRRGCVSFT